MATITIPSRRLETVRGVGTEVPRGVGGGTDKSPELPAVKSHCRCVACFPSCMVPATCVRASYAGSGGELGRT